MESTIKLLRKCLTDAQEQRNEMERDLRMLYESQKSSQNKKGVWLWDQAERPCRKNDVKRADGTQITFPGYVWTVTANMLPILGDMMTYVTFGMIERS